jgi:hypothetical protein
MTSDYLLRLLHRAHFGFAASLLYGVTTVVLVWQLQPGLASRYVEAFVVAFNCLVSGGIVFGTFLFVLSTEKSVTRVIEGSFSKATLAKTSYGKFRKRYVSKIGAAVFCANYAVIGFAIFYFCEFPFPGLASAFMILFACMEYAAAAYVGRKIYFMTHMLNSLSTIRLRKSILSNRELTRIAGYVNIVSIMTIASIYVNTTGYYNGPFVYHSIFGLSPRIMLLILVVAATPAIIIFNFYPRVVLRRLYEQSIEREILALKKRLADSQLSPTEFETVMIDYDRLKQAELKERLQLTLSDVPILVAIALALFGFVSKL